MNISKLFPLPLQKSCKLTIYSAFRNHDAWGDQWHGGYFISRWQLTRDFLDGPTNFRMVQIHLSWVLILIDGDFSEGVNLLHDTGHLFMILMAV